MIGRLAGTLADIGEDYVLIDVAGVGYEVYCHPRLMRRLPLANTPLTLTIETVVREDMIRLYGFCDQDERVWFRLLQTVQSVGARVAMAIVGTLEPDEMALAIASADARPFTRATGVGKRLAERLVAELKGKTPAAPIAAAAAGDVRLAPARAPAGGAAEDAVSALLNLGFSEEAARGAVRTVQGRTAPDATVATLIRLGLKELST